VILSVKKYVLSGTLSLLFVVAFAAPGNNSLLACMANECYDEPSQIMQIATAKAAELIDSFYQKRRKLDGFNGCVMVAKDGKPIYSAAFGYGNYHQKDTLTLQSPIQLASVSKTFTSSAILLLAEEGFLSLDDSIQKFFPEFPYSGITVKLLLSHRSGLSDYIYWDKNFVGTDVKYLTNDKVLELLINKKPALRTRPDRMFLYCNTNYALLASIVEKVSGMNYKKFMRDVFFSPLGMNNTYVYSIEDSNSVYRTTSYESHWREWRDGMYDGVYGDKGIYSSAEDMLKWDNALRSGLVLSKEALLEAYRPRSLDRYSFVKEREKNYGYGWRITRRPDNTSLIYHNGFWHGSNNVFARDLENGYTIIVLGNKSNQNNYWTQPVWEVLNQLKTFENIAEVQ
jgi:CubicO group peptidase (beta-lactamase class C family)